MNDRFEPDAPKPKPVRNWLTRWAEFVGWLPMMVGIAAIAWFYLGAVDDRDNLIRVLRQLPVVCAYAFAAAGITYLVWRKWSIRRTQAQLDDYWMRLMNNEPGAQRIFLINAVFFLCALLALLFFFKPPR